MITAVVSVPRGACSARPVQYELSPAEVASLSRRAGGGVSEGGVDEIPGFPRELWFRGVDDERSDVEDEEVEQGNDEESVDFEEEDAEDVVLRPSDAVFLAACAEEDGSWIEMQVYDAAGSLYVHHDISLPGFPLAMDWLGMTTASGYSYCAVGLADGSIEVWNLDVLDPLEPSVMFQREEEGDCAVLSLSWNRILVDCLASSSSEATTTIHDLSSGISMRHWKGHTGNVQGTAWHPEEAAVLATGADDARLIVRDCRAADSVIAHDASGQIEAISWLGSAKIIAGCDDGTIHCVDPRRMDSKVWRLDAHSKSCHGIAISGDVVASASDDKSIKLWSTSQDRPKPLCAKSMGAGKLFDVCFDEYSPYLLASAGSKGILALWDAEDDVSVARTESASKVV